MKRKLKKAFVTLATLGVTVGVGTIQAGSLVLGDAGWTATWDDSLDPFLSIALDIQSNDSDSVLIEKSVTYSSDFLNERGFIEPVPIVFQQTDTDAKRLIIITDETITNNTGVNWDSFRMTLLQGSTGTEADTRFDVDGTGIGTPGGFDIAPFTNAEFSVNNQVLTLSGGTVADGDVFTPGQGPNAGELVITALPTNGGQSLRTFVLKEQPGPGTTPPVVIPIPAAAWTGLSGLLGLGLFAAARKIRSLV